MSDLNSQKIAEMYEGLSLELGKKIIGQNDIIRLLIASLFANGHCLLIGVPGLAKTLLVKSLSEALGLGFNRIQFTPDLMPSDIIGSEILKDKAGQLEFEYQQGPIFTNLLLADEINRTPPKTQSALLEAMQEREVTVAGKTRRLDNPFFVVATQNPIEQEGTYPLPEAQLDRFMFSLFLDYPSRSEEYEVVKSTTGSLNSNLNVVMSKDQILDIHKFLREMPVSDHVIRYAVDLVACTRPGDSLAPTVTQEFVEWGAGPRASQYLILAAKAFCLQEGRVSPEVKDVKAVAYAILGHRIYVNYRATGEGMTAVNVIEELLSNVRENDYK